MFIFYYQILLKLDINVVAHIAYLVAELHANKSLRIRSYKGEQIGSETQVNVGVLL